MKILKTIFKNPLMTFYCGFLIPVFIDVYLYNPIAAPTVTATTASITLGLAIYAASKVNKWFSDKIRDRKFDKAHSYFDDQLKLYVACSHLNAQISGFLFTSKILEKTYKMERLSNIRESHQHAIKTLIDMAATREHFKATKINFRVSKLSSKYTQRAARFIKCVADLLNSFDPVIFEMIPEAEKKQEIIVKCNKLKSASIGFFNSFEYLGSRMIQISFEDMFSLNED